MNCRVGFPAAAESSLLCLRPRERLFFRSFSRFFTLDSCARVKLSDRDARENYTAPSFISLLASRRTISRRPASSQMIGFNSLLTRALYERDLFKIKE